MDLIGTLVISAACSWASPGAGRFTGEPTLAVEHYQDIPKSTREALKRRIANHSYTEVVTIKRDSIGDGSYEAELTDMHFGSHKLCRRVDRSSWKADAVERGVVYCEDGFCVIIPTVCGNISRIKPAPAKQAKEHQALEPISGGLAIFTPLSPLPQQLALTELEQPKSASVVDPAPSSSFVAMSYVIAPTSFYYIQAVSTPPLSPYPEPSTWSLLLAGLCSIAFKGYQLKRR